MTAAYHQGSIDGAKKRAKEAGVEDRVQFAVAKSTDYPGKADDLRERAARATTRCAPTSRAWPRARGDGTMRR